MQRRSLHRLAFNLHLLGSLAFGLFISVVAVTGGIIGFEAEIDRFLHRDISYVKPGERLLTLSQVQEAAALVYPDEPVIAIFPALAKNLAWQVVLPSGIAYFNPYTGQALGLRTRGESFLAKVRSVDWRHSGQVVDGGSAALANHGNIPVVASEAVPMARIDFTTYVLAGFA